MSERPWYKRYGGDFVVGTLSLTLEERGAYSTLLDLMYDRDGRYPDDARAIARLFGVSPRKWATIRETLIAAGKIEVADGYLTNARVQREMAKMADERVVHAENGAKGGRKRAENAAKTSRKHAEPETNSNENNGPVQAYPEPDIEPPVVPQGDDPALFELHPEEPETPDPVLVAFSQWNVLAKRWRLPVAKDLTEARRRAIAKRLEAAGPEGWTEALAALEKSALCVGQKPPRPGSSEPWRADLDFVCQPKSFTRLREGFYGNGAVPPDGQKGPADPWPGRVREYLANRHWNRADWGAPPGKQPRPDEDPCKAPAAAQLAAGVTPWSPERAGAA